MLHVTVKLLKTTQFFAALAAYRMKMEVAMRGQAVSRSAPIHPTFLKQQGVADYG